MLRRCGAAGRVDSSVTQKRPEMRTTMKFLVLPGDGIGPELVASSVDVLQAADRRFGLNIELEYEDVGFASLEKHGTTLREEVLQKARSYDGIVLGTQSHADYPAPDNGGRNISAAFR